MNESETPIDYAKRRRKETGRAYIVSSFGRALLDCPHNRALLKRLDETIIYRS
ncbi:hypothetical protein [Paraburkholderia youngii]|uniref:hypothetical protein n=1 Tax=Paraburkholderia youngii TaxID=2782701 RepID=UPI001592AD61|nr:hypothetical protein [Paraburkholderia youngii]